MPVSFLTAEQERRYGRFNGVPTQEQLDRHLQEWFGHANIATTRLYDRRKSRPECYRRCKSLPR